MFPITRIWTSLSLFAVSFLALGVSASDSGCGHSNNARDDDDDDDGNNSSSSSFTRFHSTATTSSSTETCRPSGMGVGLPFSNDTSQSHKLTKGAVAGVVIGILFALLALALLIFCCWRRRQAQHRQRQAEAAAISGEEKGLQDSNAETGEMDASHANIPSTLRPRSGIDSSLPSVLTLLANHEYSEGTEDRHQPMTYRNLQRSTSSSSLPNPYESYNVDRDLPSVPAYNHAASSTALLATPAATVGHSLADPSSLPNSTQPSYAGILSRGFTQTSAASRLSSGSSLHSEIATYQKRLEAHHEKEMAVMQEEADEGDEGGIAGSSIPLDPPPSYQEDPNAPTSSAISDIGHSAAGSH